MTRRNSSSSNDNNNRRSVRFPEDEGQLVTVVTITIDPLSASVRWFQKDDYYEFKACARRVAKEWRKRGASPMLENTYENPSTNTQDLLTAWSRQQMGTPSRRGLENLINRDLCRERSSLRTKVISSILSAQKTMEGYGFEASMQARELALISEVYSERASQFALQMGFADAIALAEANRQESAMDDEASFPASDRSARSSESETSSDSSTLASKDPYLFSTPAATIYNSPLRQRPKAQPTRRQITLGPIHEVGSSK